MGADRRGRPAPDRAHDAEDFYPPIDFNRVIAAPTLGLSAVGRIAPAFASRVRRTGRSAQRAWVSTPYCFHFKSAERWLSSHFRRGRSLRDERLWDGCSRQELA